METNKRSIDIVVLVRSLQKTIEFEKEVSAKFHVPGAPADKEEEDEPTTYEQPPEEDDADYSVDAIRRKWRKHQEQKENDAAAKKQATLPPVQSVKFKGMHWVVAVN